MSFSLRTTILGNWLHLGNRNLRCPGPDASSSHHPAPGNYATTQGTVNIPAAGDHDNVPLNAVPAPASPAPAQGSTYFNSSFYYPRGGVFHGGRRRTPLAARILMLATNAPAAAHVSGDNEDDQDW